ncbi:FUSC family protein [Streptomyces flaveolus]|uniref:FUSC family protein n=1 Tax=Streptomyces flaveolus TaxID=67297 RepID=UPI00342BC58D
MSSMRRLLTEAWDRMVASDPGLHRAHQALSAGVVISTTIGVEYVYSRIIGAGSHATLIALLLGTVVAFTGWTALGEPRAWIKVRTAAFFPLAILVGMLPSAAVGGHTDATLVVLVALLFLTVFIRRFGAPFFFYGNLMWIGFVFAAFLKLTVSEIPSLIFAVAISSSWALLLSLTLLRIDPARVLRRVQRAFGARARAVARACADLLESAPGDEGSLIRLRSRQLRLAETALVIDGWSATADALPRGWTAAALRRRTLEAHLVVDALAAAAVSLRASGGPETEIAAHIARHLARNEYAAARELAAEASGRAPSTSGDRADLLRHFADTAREFAAFAAWDRTPPQVEDVPDFSPTAPLVFGALPGSSAVARGVSARGHWSRLRDLSQTSRQAVQVAVAGTLAVVLGRLLSPDHYYWAVAAALLAFAGTATSAESVTKAGNAVVGTLLGLASGIGLAVLTDGHTGAVLTVIVLSLTFGLYLAQVSYAFTAFFTSTAVVQLYGLLHELSADLLFLRLAETALGAGIGIFVALLVLPTNTRDTVRAARGRYFEAVAGPLRTVAEGPRDGAANDSAPDLDAQLRLLDLRTQQLALVATPLTSLLGHPVIRGNDPRRGRYRMALYTDLSLQIRTVAATVTHVPADGPRAELVRTAGILADAAEALGAAPPRPGELPGEADRLLDEAKDRLRSVPLPEPPGPAHAAVRALLGTAQLLGRIADRPTPTPGSARTPGSSFRPAGAPVRTGPASRQDH